MLSDASGSVLASQDLGFSVEHVTIRLQVAKIFEEIAIYISDKEKKRKGEAPLFNDFWPRIKTIVAVPNNLGIDPSEFKLHGRYDVLMLERLIESLDGDSNLNKFVSLANRVGQKCFFSRRIGSNESFHSMTRKLMSEIRPTDAYSFQDYEGRIKEINSLIDKERKRKEHSLQGRVDLLPNANAEIHQILNKSFNRYDGSLEKFPEDWELKREHIPMKPKEIYEGFVADKKELDSLFAEKFEACISGFTVGDSKENLSFFISIVWD